MRTRDNYFLKNMCKARLNVRSDVFSTDCFRYVVPNNDYAVTKRLFGLFVLTSWQIQFTGVRRTWGGPLEDDRPFNKHITLHFRTNFELQSLNPISGRLLATPISGRGGCLGPPLISPVISGRFLKFKRHSFRLNMIYISKKTKFQKIRKRGY